MTVEAANHINELNPALPPNGDPLGEGDDHLRKIKLVLQTDFPNITGPVTHTQATLNALVVPSVANTALSALTPAADRVPYFTGPAAAALATFTAYGRSLVAAVDAAAARVALGLGALATKATVATADIDNDAVTFAKLQNIATGSLIGRSTAATGDPEQITVGSGLTLSAGVISAPNVRRMIQRTRDVENGSGASTAVAIPADSSTPLVSEGEELFSRPFTPLSASSSIAIRAKVTLATTAGAGTDMVIALFSGSTCIAVEGVEASSTGATPVILEWEEPAGSTTPRTYSLRYGAASGTTAVNRAAAGDTYGDKIISFMVTEEFA